MLRNGLDDLRAVLCYKLLCLAHRVHPSRRWHDDQDKLTLALKLQTFFMQVNDNQRPYRSYDRDL